MLELFVAEAAGHGLSDVAAVSPADVALGLRAGVGEADAAGPSVVGIVDALDEPRGLEAGDQSRDAGPREQGVAAQLGDPPAVPRVGQGGEPARPARGGLAPGG